MVGRGGSPAGKVLYFVGNCEVNEHLESFSVSLVPTPSSRVVSGLLTKSLPSIIPLWSHDRVTGFAVLTLHLQCSIPLGCGLCTFVAINVIWLWILVFPVWLIFRQASFSSQQEQRGSIFLFLTPPFSEKGKQTSFYAGTNLYEKLKVILLNMLH